MDWYEPEVRALEAEVAQGAVATGQTVFYGSSSIRLWDTMAEDLKSRRLVNRGFGGSTLKACVYFFERLLLPLEPRALLLYAGDNDLGDGATPDTVLQSFAAFQEKLEQHFPAIPFAFMSIKPSPARFSIVDQIQATNELIKGAIAQSGHGEFINVFPSMLGRDGRPRKELFTEDGLHLSHKGYVVWAETLVPYRKRLLIENTTNSNNFGIPS